MAGNVWYTIYAADTDELLGYGDIKTCARMMGKTVNTVQSIISYTKSKKIQCYTIVREDLDAKTYEVFGEDNRGHEQGKRGKRMMELYNLGFSDKEIATRLDMNPSQVRSWRQHKKLRSHTPPGNPNGFEQMKAKEAKTA